MKRSLLFLFTLAGGLEHMQVLAQVAEGDVNKVTRGLPVEFTVSEPGWPRTENFRMREAT